MPPKGYLKRLREICDKYGILLIFDEVITGWGRTGDSFAPQSFDVTPDIIKMASMLGGVSQPGISQAAATNPLLYYGYYSQMLQGNLLYCKYLNS